MLQWLYGSWNLPEKLASPVWDIQYYKVKRDFVVKNKLTQIVNKTKELLTLNKYGELKTILHHATIYLLPSRDSQSCYSIEASI